MAVEAVVLFNYFQTRLSRTTVEVRLVTDEFLELLRERPQLAAGAGAPVPTAEQKPASA